MSCKQRKPCFVNWIVMKLLVSIIEAKNIPALDPNGFCDPYVKLKLGRQRFKSEVVKKCLNPSWNEDATFKVDDLNKKLKISVLDENYFSDDCIGWIKVSISQLFDAKDQSLGTAWYKLHPKNKKAKNKDCGEICLTISLSQISTVLDLPPPSLQDSSVSTKEEMQDSSFAGRVGQIFNRNSDITSMSSGSTDASEDESETSVDHEQQSEEQPSSVDYEELIRCMETREQEDEIPNPLSGGTVLDCLYEISPKELNSLLFSPESDFTRSYADMLGSTDLKMDSWKIGDALKRMVSYTKPASKLVKALKASEEQTYLKADGSSYAILSTVSTLDAPCGKSFRTEVLYLITSGPEQPSSAPSSRLVVSWRINFLQSTMLRSMIENGARQGIKESFGQYEMLLSQRVKPLDGSNSTPDANPLLVAVEPESQSIWKLAVQYFWNITTVSALLMLLYMLTHMWLVAPNKLNGLEFVGLDLPDSINELIVCLVLVLQGKRVLEFISSFMRARLRKGCDNGIKAQGTGWLLTVALIEGSNLATIDSNGLSNPFVIFTCTGKSRTSSVKFHRSDPLWNEIFEFDAMDEPPSILEIQVLGFNGRFNEAPSFGNAEINFLKSNISDLSDIWIPLRGQLAQACHSKLHIRIFLNNPRGTNAVKDYLAKVEKEVGKKIKLRSPQTNSAFQKLFGLPPEEFLINNFTCHLKRKMPLQGRLFLSTRIAGFHADLFGHKTNFFFLWEDIEDIHVTPPTLYSMGIPIIIMILRPGRGFDARHGAKKQDAEGRLNFHFHSFVSFNVAKRTIMTLWKTRASIPEQKNAVEEEYEVQTGEDDDVDESCEELDAKSIQTDETTTDFLLVDDVTMSPLCSFTLSLPMAFLMELFNGGDIEQRVMEKSGCIDYTHTEWQLQQQQIHQRQVHYAFEKLMRKRCRGQVTSIQQKTPISDSRSWIIQEAASLQRIPLSEYITVHLRYEMEDLASNSAGRCCCGMKVKLGISWLKKHPSNHYKKMGKRMKSMMKKRIKVMMRLMEKEFASRTT